MLDIEQVNPIIENTTSISNLFTSCQKTDTSKSWKNKLRLRSHMCCCYFVTVLCEHTHSGQAWSINGSFAQSSKCQGPTALRGSHLFLSVFLVSLLHESSHVNREKRIKTKEQTTNAELCLLQSSSKRGMLQQRPERGTCVWATLPFAAVVVTKSSNSLMLPRRLAAEPQRMAFSLTPLSAAEHQLRRNIDVPLCVLAPQAVVDPTLAQVSKKPRHQIKSGTSEHCFIAELWHHSAQSKLKIKPFMSAYLSAWEMRLTQGTVHSAMRSGPRSPPLPVPRQRSTITFPQ